MGSYHGSTVAVRRRGEPRISRCCGIPAILIALLAMLLLGSYLLGRPVGLPHLYDVELVRGEEFDVNGQSIGDVWRKRYLPSMPFLGLVLVNSCLAAMGISLARRRSMTRPVWTSATALILSVSAFGLILLCWLLAGI